MAEDQPVRYCPSCIGENPPDSERCIFCGALLELPPEQRRRALALMLNELADLRSEQALDRETFATLSSSLLERMRWLEARPAPAREARLGPLFWLGLAFGLLGLFTLQGSAAFGLFLLVIGAGLAYWGYQNAERGARKPQAPRPSFRPGPAAVPLSRYTTPAPAVRPPPPVVQMPVPPAHAVPSPTAKQPSLASAVAAWTAEQEANLLLYLGAFLIVVATLVLVGSTQRTIGAAGNMALLVAGTAAFLISGLVCLKGARVRQAGAVFVAVSALMFPLNFVGAYAFFLRDAELDRAVLWLGGSLASATFYGVVSFLGIGRWYPVPSATALVSADIAALSLLDAPPEAYPASLVFVAVLLVASGIARFDRLTEVLGTPWYWLAHAVVLAGLAGAAALSNWQAYEADTREVVDYLWGVDVAGLAFDWMWMGAAVASLAFFAPVAWLRSGRWQEYAAVLSLEGVLASGLAVGGAPVEVFPVTFATLALLLSTPAVVGLGRAGSVFGLPSLTFSYLTIACSVVAAWALREEPDGRYLLLGTLTAAAGFFWLQALAAKDELLKDIGLSPLMSEAFALQADSRVASEMRPGLGLVALVLSGVLPSASVYAFDLRSEWYGPALLGAALAYAVAVSPPAPRWDGRRFCGWLAVGTASIAVSLSALLGDTAFIAAVGSAVTAMYLLLARLHQDDETVLSGMPTKGVTLVLTHAAGASLSGAFYSFLDATSVVDTGNAVDVAYAFFGLSLVLTALGMSSRWWWAEARLSLYSVSLIMGLCVFLTATDHVDKAWIVLVSYTFASFVVALWERQPLFGALSAGYGFFAVLATWRYLESSDAYAPLLVSAAGIAMLVAGSRLARFLSSTAEAWAEVLRWAGIAYLALAPVAAWVSVLVLTDRDTAITRESDSRLLAQFTTVVVLASLAAGLHAWLRLRQLDLLAGAAVVLSIAGALAQMSMDAEYRLFPAHAVAMNLAGIAFLAVAAWLLERGPVAGSTAWDSGLEESERSAFAGALQYMALLALNSAYYYALPHLGRIDLDDSETVGWAFGGLVLAEIVLGATSRWTWRSLRWPAFAAAISTTLVCIAVLDGREGQLALLLVLFAAAAVTVSLWEREPVGLLLAAAYGFASVFPGRAHFEADHALVPLTLAGAGAGVFGLSMVFARSTRWSAVLSYLGFAYAALAPLVGGSLIIDLADTRGYIGQEHFLDTYLYQATVISLVALGVLIAETSMIARSQLLALLASVVLLGALLLEIAHLRPANVQAYTAPVGIYLLTLVLIVSRYGRLPEALSPWLERAFGLGPTVLMAPSFLESLESGAWLYGLVLLLESLAFLALAVLQRRTWLLSIAVSFVVANGLHYLFFEKTLPTWATLSIAGLLLMAAGTAILSSRDRWPKVQDAVVSWWQRGGGRPRMGHA